MNKRSCIHSLKSFSLRLHLLYYLILILKYKVCPNKSLGSSIKSSKIGSSSSIGYPFSWTGSMDILIDATSPSSPTRIKLLDEDKIKGTLKSLKSP